MKRNREKVLDEERKKLITDKARTVHESFSQRGSSASEQQQQKQQQQQQKVQQLEDARHINEAKAEVSQRTDNSLIMIEL